MWSVGQFRIASEKEKTESVARLVKHSTGDFDFYLFVLLAVSMASLGLVLNSPEVIIGSMLIAPALYPILSGALGLVLYDMQLTYRSLRTLLITIAAAVLIGWCLTSLLALFMHVGVAVELAKRATPSTLYFLVAFVSGFAATYSLVHANLNETLPGVAISVSLVPPLAAVGVAAALGQYAVAGGALALFLLNVAGIVLAGMIAFTLMDMHGTYKVVASAIHQEDKRLIDEQKKIEAISEQ